MYVFRARSETSVTAPLILHHGTEWNSLRTGRFSPEGRIFSKHYIGGCVGPRVDLGVLYRGADKSLARPD